MPTFLKEPLWVTSINCFRLSGLVTGLVTVDGNSEGSLSGSRLDMCEGGCWCGLLIRA